MKPAVVPLEPHLKTVLWGGSRLQLGYGKDAPSDVSLGEAWEVSCFPGQESREAAGGEPLSALIAREPAHFLGLTRAREDFPLLVKLICTQQLLSLQVHPDDSAALRFEGRALGKREAWMVLEAEPGAFVLLGMKEGARLADFEAAARAQDSARLEGLMRRIEARPGQVYDLLPGTVHALGPGIVALEVQQPTDLTYRLHDWGRLGPDGVPRPIHLEKALSVIDPSSRPMPLPPTPVARGFAAELLVAHASFRLERWRIGRRVDLPVRELLAVTCLGGRGTIAAAGGAPVELSRGRSCLVAALAAMVRIEGSDLDLAVASR